MNEYMSIGKVAKLKNVSIKSLRYYDSIGILKPAFVNIETNYRYYTKDQLYLLDAISLCIKLGIPLKDLKKYVQGDSINLQELLYDGKVRAEQQILEIRANLELLQNTLQNMALTTGLVKIPASTRAAIPAKKNTEETSAFMLPQICRHLLMVPLDPETTPKYYGQFILKLFVCAQQLGLQASYPSGVLYEYTGHGIDRFMFLLLSNIKDIPAHLENIQDNPQGVCVRELPAGTYLSSELTEHLDFDKLPKSSPLELFSTDVEHEDLETAPSWFLEIDVMDSVQKANGTQFQLEYYLL
ncbi:MAG: MerR family transcriptional regulator [Lachnospiraceae bacterium]|nr:MerR family transcriptional regulator [Lachnospiraceae bacterium]